MIYAFMLLAAVTVCVAMFATLTWFFRRLRRIEEDLMGPSTRLPWRVQLANQIFRFRQRAPKG